jgi:acyl-coenzyme A synthetase/AMP-(fatty) acid ligase
VPLGVAVPAAAAGLAYLNARAALWNDVHLLGSALPASLRLLLRSRRDRLNPFYVLEWWATSSSARRPMLIFEGRTHTYGEVYDAALRYGAWLRQRHGVVPGDVVAMDFENSDIFIVLWMALWSIGAKPAFINHNLTGDALAHCVRAAGAKLMLVDPNVARHVVGSKGDGEALSAALRPAVVAFVVLTPQLQAEALATEPVRAPDEDRSEDKGENLAMLVYTSGTTGLPKPAVVSFAKCIVAGIYVARWLRRGQNSIMYSVSSSRQPTSYCKPAWPRLPLRFHMQSVSWWRTDRHRA